MQHESFVLESQFTPRYRVVAFSLGCHLNVPLDIFCPVSCELLELMLQLMCTNVGEVGKVHVPMLTRVSSKRAELYPSLGTHSHDSRRRCPCLYRQEEVPNATGHI